MDQNLLRSYLATVYELPTTDGTLRVSLDGEASSGDSELPALLQSPFAILTAHNPRSMQLPRRVNDARHTVLRDLLIMGCYRVEHCIGFDDEQEVSWREPAWLVHGIDQQEAIDFGRTFRQNTIIVCQDSRPVLIATDPTCDEIGRSFPGNWRLRQ